MGSHELRDDVWEPSASKAVLVGILLHPHDQSRGASTRSSAWVEQHQLEAVPLRNTGRCLIYSLRRTLDTTFAVASEMNRNDRCHRMCCFRHKSLGMRPFVAK